MLSSDICQLILNLYFTFAIGYLLYKNPPKRYR